MDFIDAADKVFNEYAAGVEKYGTWSDYPVVDMLEVIVVELLEAEDAINRGDIHGEHGVIRELAQVSACCLKAIMVLSGRPSITLAEILQPAGLNSEGRGCSPPASPSLHQGKDSAANSPEEGCRI